MASLVLVIILNVLILSLFRLLSQFLVNTYQTVIINYWTCAFISLLIIGDLNFLTLENLKSWIWFASFLGLIFVVTFYLIALTTQTFEISIASLASKISLVIPVTFSILILKSYTHNVDGLNYLGLLLAFCSIILSSMNRGIGKANHNWKLPFLVFILTGVIDASLNYANLKLIEPEETYPFTAMLFFSAAFWGTIAFLVSNKRIEKKSISWGIVLGTINIFSVVLLLKALSHFNNDGAFVFPLVNVSIIIVASITSYLAFGDRINRVKLIGIVLGILSILLIAHQGLFGW